MNNLCPQANFHVHLKGFTKYGCGLMSSEVLHGILQSNKTCGYLTERRVEKVSTVHDHFVNVVN